MIDKFLGVLAGYFFCKILSQDWLNNLFGAKPPGGAPVSYIPTQSGQPVYTSSTVPQGATPAHLPPGAVPVVSPGAVPAPEAKPAGLPPFPSGWTFLKPVTQAVVQRAWALLPLLKMGQVKYELEPGGQMRWLAYRKEPHAQGKTGVTVYVPRAQAVPEPPPAPHPMTPTYASAPGPSPMGPTVGPAPGPARPGQPRTLRRGMRGPDVAEWQGYIGQPADGVFGAGTEAATRGWQGRHGLKPDGIVGPKTLAAARAEAGPPQGVMSGYEERVDAGPDLQGDGTEGEGEQVA